MRLIPLLSLLALGCADTTMTTEGYDDSCDEAGDCVAVFVGDTCGCGCETEAIRADEYEAYQQEWADAQAQCTAVPDCAPCQDVVVECVDRRCEVTGTVE